MKQRWEQKRINVETLEEAFFRSSNKNVLYILIDYRRDFNDKKDDSGANGSCTKVETKFGNVISRGRVSATNTVDILSNVTQVKDSFDFSISIKKTGIFWARKNT